MSFESNQRNCMVLQLFEQEELPHKACNSWWLWDTSLFVGLLAFVRHYFHMIWIQNLTCFHWCFWACVSASGNHFFFQFKAKLYRSKVIQVGSDLRRSTDPFPLAWHQISLFPKSNAIICYFVILNIFAALFCERVASFGKDLKAGRRECPVCQGLLPVMSKLTLIWAMLEAILK